MNYHNWSWSFVIGDSCHEQSRIYYYLVISIHEQTCLCILLNTTFIHSWTFMDMLLYVKIIFIHEWSCSDCEWLQSLYIKHLYTFMKKEQIVSFTACDWLWMFTIHAIWATREEMEMASEGPAFQGFLPSCHSQSNNLPKLPTNATPNIMENFINCCLVLLLFPGMSSFMATESKGLNNVGCGAAIFTRSSSLRLVYFSTALYRNPITFTWFWQPWCLIMKLPFEISNPIATILLFSLWKRRLLSGFLINISLYVHEP